MGDRHHYDPDPSHPARTTETDDGEPSKNAENPAQNPKNPRRI